MTEATKWGPYCSKCGHPSTYHGKSFCQVDAGSVSKRQCDCDGYRPASLVRLGRAVSAGGTDDR